jgi:hypothetical protein
MRGNRRCGRGRPGRPTTHRGERGPHTEPRGVFGGPPCYLRVRLRHRVAERTEQGSNADVRVMGSQRLDHRGTGNLTCGVAAHTVSDREQPTTRVSRILVVLPDETRLGSSSGNQGKCCGHLNTYPSQLGVRPQRQAATLTPIWVTCRLPTVGGRGREGYSGNSLIWLQQSGPRPHTTLTEVDILVPLQGSLSRDGRRA